MYVPSKGLTIQQENRKNNKSGVSFLPYISICTEKSVHVKAQNSKIYTAEGSPSNRAHKKNLNKIQGRARTRGIEICRKDTCSVAGSEVFGNPVTPVPENPKARHPSRNIKIYLKLVQQTGSKGWSLGPWKPSPADT